MPTPTAQQARSHYAARSAITTAAAVNVGRQVAQARPWSDVLTLLASYQLAAATLAIRTMASWAGARTPATEPRVFAGVSSSGFPISEPLIATIDRYAPAPPTELPAPWWDDAEEFRRQVEQLIESEVADAARTAAQVELNSHEEFTHYVRLLQLPSCKRCVILAGRIYRDLDGFERHPLCDCIHVPVNSLDEALAAGLVNDPMVAFERGQIRGLSAADTQAIKDGADINRVVNATRAAMRAPAGITNARRFDLFGRRGVKITLDNTTKRSQWRKANPTRLVRLRPEAIYQFARDHDDALRLLRLYGYLL